MSPAGGATTRHLLQRAAQSASYNMLVQLMIRVISFTLNAFVIRYTSPQMLGLANVRLMLLYTTGQFVCREAFRRACLQEPARGDHNENDESKSPPQPVTSFQRLVDITWLQVPMSVLVMPVICYVWLHWLEQPAPDLVSPSDMRAAVILYGGCVVLEMFAEPLYIMAQTLLLVHVKVVIISACAVIRTVTVVVAIHAYQHFHITQHSPIYIFCVAQLCDSMCYVAFHYFYFAYHSRTTRDQWTFTDIFPNIADIMRWRMDRRVLQLVGSFFKQGVMKQLLTEGERYMMTFFNVISLHSQGVYDVVSNLGSLSARLILQPIEESSYLYFTHAVQRGDHKPGEIAEKSPKTSQNAMDTSKQEAFLVLCKLLKMVTLLGVTILVFGYSYSHLALRVYGGDVLSSGEGPTLLRAHCIYILIIAVNGVSESFVFALMSSDQINAYNYKLVYFSVLYLLSAYRLTTWFGSVGFIYANCLNMALRIVHSIYYIHYCTRIVTSIHECLPNIRTVLYYLLVFMITAYSEHMLCCKYGLTYMIYHLAIGAITGLTLLALLYRSEQDLVIFMYELALKQKSE